jgi:SAM-dependent methyltransferase
MESTEYDLMDAAEQDMWWYRALHARLAAALAGAAGPILDAGCGTGGLLARLGRKDCVGLEFDARAADRAAAKSKSGIVRGSVNAMPFRHGVFGAAVSADVLCHAAVDPEAAIGELHRVLRSGGRLVLNLPSYQWLLSAHDHRVHNVRRFTGAGARALLAGCGFEAIRTRYWNGLLLPLMVAQRKLFARGNHAASDVAPFSPWLNASLHGITVLERRLPFPLPAGGSLLVVARKSGDSPS